MLEAEPRERQLRDDEEQHDQQTDELVRDEGLDEHREHGVEHHVDEPRQYIPGEVVAELERGVTLERLHRDRGADADQRRREQDDRNREDLRDEEGQVRRRRRVDHLVHPQLSVAPNEFARIVSRDDQRNGRELLDQGLNHHPRHREDRAHRVVAGQPEPDDRVDEGDAEQDGVGGTPKRGQHVESGQRGEWPPTEVAIRRRPGRMRARGRRRRLDAAGHPVELAALGQRSALRAKHPPREAEQGERDGEPQRAVLEHGPPHRWP